MSYEYRIETRGIATLRYPVTVAELATVGEWFLNQYPNGTELSVTNDHNAGTLVITGPAKEGR